MSLTAQSICFNTKPIVYAHRLIYYIITYNNIHNINIHVNHLNREGDGVSRFYIKTNIYNNLLINKFHATIIHNN